MLMTPLVASTALRESVFMLNTYWRHACRASARSNSPQRRVSDIVGIMARSYAADTDDVGYKKDGAGGMDRRSKTVDEERS